MSKTSLFPIFYFGMLQFEFFTNYRHSVTCINLQILASAIITHSIGRHSMLTLKIFPAKQSPVHESVIFAHSIAEHGMSQQGMFINMNTTYKDKYVPLRPCPHLFQDGVSFETCICILKILMQFDT